MTMDNTKVEEDKEKFLDEREPWNQLDKSEMISIHR